MSSGGSRLAWGSGVGNAGGGLLAIGGAGGGLVITSGLLVGGGRTGSGVNRRGLGDGRKHLGGDSLATSLAGTTISRLSRGVGVLVVTTLGGSRGAVIGGGLDGLTGGEGDLAVGGVDNGADVHGVNKGAWGESVWWIWL